MDQGEDRSIKQARVLSQGQDIAKLTRATSEDIKTRALSQNHGITRQTRVTSQDMQTITSSQNHSIARQTRVTSQDMQTRVLSRNHDVAKQTRGASQGMQTKTLDMKTRALSLDGLSKYSAAIKAAVEVRLDAAGSQQGKDKSVEQSLIVKQDEDEFSKSDKNAEGVEGIEPPTSTSNTSVLSLEAFDRTPIFCLKHFGVEAELFCKTCGDPICLRCGIKGGKHYKHEYEEIGTAADRMKDQIVRTSLHSYESQLLSASDSLDHITSRYKEILKRQDIIEESIESVFSKCEEDLRIRKVELINQLHQMTVGKLRTLQSQREKIEATQTMLDNSVGSMRKSLSAPNKHVLQLRKLRKFMSAGGNSSASGEASVLQLDLLKPATEADMVFAYSVGLIMKFRSFGHLFAAGSPDPSKCYLTIKSLEAVSSKNSTVILQLADYDGKPIKHSVASVESELVSALSGEVFHCEVEKYSKQGQYKITYQTSTKGKHDLLVKVEGHHVKGSPFSVTVKSTIKELGTPILSFNGLRAPHGIAVTKKGEILVSEDAASCIAVYSHKGECIRSFGVAGGCKSQLKAPRGMTLDGQGDIIVADSGNHRIQKFSVLGDFIGSSIVGKTGLPVTSYPTGIAYNSTNNRLYVADLDNCISVFTPDLSLMSTFGRKGKDKCCFKSPWSVACDSIGNVYVADTGNHRIQVFTAEGKFLRKFGSHGSKNGELSRPAGIAVSGDMVYISEYSNHRISVFNAEGHFVHSFGSRGETPGMFQDPFGLTVDSSDLVYVCDLGNNRIQVL